MSKREKVLVTALILLAVGYLIYNFIYLPKLEEMTQLESELELIQAERLEAEIKIASISVIESDIAKEMETALIGAPAFFSELPQENLIVFLNDIAERASLGVTSYSFSPIAIPSAEPGKVSVSLSYTGDYGQLLEYMKIIEAYEKQITVSSLSAASDGMLSGTMTLDFHVLDKFFPDSSDLEFLRWKYNMSKGKENPFGSPVISEGEVVEQPEREILSHNAATTPDFFMIARAAASSMPTMTIGTGRDTTGETYLRSTTNGVENVTAEFTRNSEKYYFSYKTDNRAHPVTEFTPVKTGSINFAVYSRKRVDGADTNLINLVVINNTGLELNLTVDGDDKNRPRVNVVKR